MIEQNPYALFLAELAKRRGITVRRLEPTGRLGRYEYRGRVQFVGGGAIIDAASGATVRLANNKYATINALRLGGFPVAYHRLCKSTDEARTFLGRHRDIVIKPVDSIRGQGITVGVKTRRQLAAAVRHVHRRTFLAERRIIGRDYRLLVINYKIVYGILRLPAYVVGDGRSMIRQLINEKNRIPIDYKVAIPKDQLTKDVLREQRLTLASVPAAERVLTLRQTANLHTGGTTVDATDDLRAAVRRQAIAVARYLKLPVAGIDVISPDIKKSFGTIIEVNAGAGLRIHHFPHIGRPRLPGEDILDMLFPATKHRRATVTPKRLARLSK